MIVLRGAELLKERAAVERRVFLGFIDEELEFDPLSSGSTDRSTMQRVLVMGG
jgi:hypothetical protein